ncbi:MAG: heavy metal translocating P-type ATPase [Bacteroidia bacterium]|jgi:Cu2+-exporting ATPase|nr:heavy metal translocating P-type ATPase [Bacteroidia bacterium]
MNDKEVTTVFSVTGLSCASCAGSVEQLLLATSGVNKAVVNYASSSAVVSHQPNLSISQLQQAVKNIGYELWLVDEELNPAKIEEQKKRAWYSLRNQTILAAVLTIPVVVIGMFFMHWQNGIYLSMLLSAPVVFVIGRLFFIRAYMQVQRLHAGMDVLVALSTGVAFLFSVYQTILMMITPGLHLPVYYESASVVIVFVLLGKLLEEKAKWSTNAALQTLMQLQPDEVTVIRNNQPEKVRAAYVFPGDVILSKPGEHISLDGEISDGETWIDEQMMTGESLPVLKQKGDKVFAGTVNKTGVINYVATATGNKTFLAQLVKRVQTAQSTKAPVEQYTDKVVAIFVPVVIALAVITFFVWLLIGGEQSLHHALITSLSVLVIACPCALGLATPTAIMVGMGKGATHQILIKDAGSLELASRIDTIVLDKTGTITTGKLNVIKTIHASTQEQELVLAKWLALAQTSNHPVSIAVVNYLKERVQSSDKVEFARTISGKGITGMINQQPYYSGNLLFMEAHGICIPKFIMQQLDEQNFGATAVLFADAKEVLVLMWVSDVVHEQSKHAIEKLQLSGIDVFMLTGDRLAAALPVAKEVGIVHIKANVDPQEKAKFVNELKQSGKTVAMVGDGINDSEALAVADVSIAMGKGTDIAMQVAHITLVNNDLRLIQKAINLSKQTVEGIKQNLFWAFIYNLIGIPLAAGILFPINGFLLNPMIAGAAMAFSSLSVVLNSIRLKYKNINNDN